MFSKINPVVRAYIVSESFLWSAWNFVTPIFAVFVVSQIRGGSIETAAFGYSILLLARVCCELLVGKVLLNSSDRKKFTVAVIGILVMTAAYLSFTTARTIPQFFIFYTILGAGLGIASPAKNSLFARHLDKNKEATEWAIQDAAIFTSMAAAAAIGGYVAKNFGFDALFVIASIINTSAIIPYYAKMKLKLDVFSPS